MAAKLSSTVFVKDPDTHQTVELAEGTSPEARLAVLVTNPSAWVGGELPGLTKPESAGGAGPTEDGPDDVSGDASGDGGDAADSRPAPAKKTAARKTAATKPARGRDAADQGDSGE